MDYRPPPESGRLLVTDGEQYVRCFACEPSGLVVVLSDRAPDKVTANEDGALVLPIDSGRCVLAVADGLGGLPAGEHASRSALDALADAVREAVRAGRGLREGILSGFDRANRLVSGTGGATTLMAAEIEGDSVRTYHVGDSGALVFGSRGKLRLQTIDHSPVGYALEAGVLDEADAMAHADRHLISNVIGDPGMHVTMSSSLRLKRQDTCLLASDGLFDNFYTDEIVDRLRTGRLEERVRELARGCAERMAAPRGDRPHKPDDVTVVAYRPGGR